jgi:alpha-1,6-mannosyltransferase
MCSYARNGQWGAASDFWEHSAVLRELSTHILNPKHPQLLLDSPHAFYSPYAVLLAAFSRFSTLDPVTTLSIAGLVNLGLFFLGLRLFVLSIVPRERGNIASFYALLFVLLWWGSDPWSYSGFFYFGGLGGRLPYPSTFSTSLSLICLGSARTGLEQKSPVRILGFLVVLVAVLISHPISFLFLVAGLLSFAFDTKGRTLTQVLIVVSLLVMALLIASMWPYFPFLKFLVNESDVYHANNRVMYRDVLSRIWPALIGVPLIISKLHQNWRHPLAIVIVILSGIYVFGGVSGKYAFGRVISHIVLVLQVAIADRVSEFELQISRGHRASWLRRLTVTTGAIAFSFVLSWKGLNTVLASATSREPNYTSYLFLSRMTGQYDLILSDIRSSWIVPTFGGKVVAALHPLAFVPDDNIRKSDLKQFFSKATTLGERRRMIEKYDAKYVLLNKLMLGDCHECLLAFESLGKSIFENESFLLISVSPEDERPDDMLLH